MTLTFHRYGSTDTTDTLELDEAKSSIIDKLNEPTRLSAILTSETAPSLQLGARTTYKGVAYYVTKEPTVRKEHSKLYTIEAELETAIGLARHVILCNPVDKRASFDYTATATEHLQLVVDSLNGKKLSKIPAWTRGDVHCTNTVKHIKYDGVSAWDALQLIRQTYETDLHIDGTAIALGIWGSKARAIELAYGKGNGILSGLERIKHDDTPTPMSLYVTGTKRNMTKGRLTMQTLETLRVDDNGTIYHGSTPGIAGRLYGTDKTGQYISEIAHDNGTQPLCTEATYTNEEIYPSHVSTIQTVEKVKDHYEVNSDLDYTALRLEGEQMQVVFQTGNLAGREFDARHYTRSGRLAIVPKEEDDTTLPSDILCPKVGDQYIVTGIKLPDEYIREAQRNLTEEALRHLVKLQQQRYSYKAEIDPVYLHNHKTTIGNKLDVGQYVHLTDQQIAVGDPYIRIVGKRTYLDRPYTPEIELSNEVEGLSLFERFIRDFDGIIADREVILGRITASSVVLDGLTHTSTDLSKRLDGAEQAIGGKLDSGAFDKWRAGELHNALASKQPAGSYVLASELESHKRATDKSLAELSNHPLTVDSNGYWRIWSVKDGAYKTTQYPSRGQDGARGADGKDAGRYLGRANSLGTSFTRNYISEDSGMWETANEGDYVYMTTDGGSRWHKDTYYIVRERKSKTVWEQYDIKGRDGEDGAKGDQGDKGADGHTPVIRWDGTKLLIDDLQAVDLRGHDGQDGAKGDKGDTPKLTLDNQCRLLADGERISDVSLKGDKGDKGDQGDKGDKGAKGDKGDKPILTLNDKFQLLADGEIVKQESLKGDKGEQGDKGDRGPKGDKGDKPDPEEVLHTDRFGKLLSSEVTKQVSSEVTKQVKPVSDNLSTVSDNLSTVSDILTTANGQITDLKNVALTPKTKDDITYLTNALQVLKSGDNGTLEGLALQRIIALSGDNETVSAYIASQPMDTALKAGITDFGTPTERERVAINHNGTGHIGNLYFAGSQIDFRTSWDTDPYLSIGAEESEFIDNFITTARLDDTPVSASSVALTTSTSRYVRTVDVANDGTRLTVSIGDLNVETYRGATTRLTLDGEVLAEWQGVVDIVDGGGGGVNIKPQTIRKPYTASNLSYERVVKAGSHTLRLEIVNPTSGATATVRGLRVRRLYDTGRQQSVLTKSGLRLFGSPDRYLDVDYRQTYVDKSGFSYTRADNDYTVRIKGGAHVDKLTADELDMPGVPLCGASFNERGTQIKAFGKYVNQQGTSRAQAVYYDSGRFFRVFHSIGHTNYLPTVQVIGDNGNDINWNLTARIYAVNANDFAVRIITNGDNPIRHAFSFVAFKTM